MGEFKEKLPVVTQFPEPGISMVMYCGDQIKFTLEVKPEICGKAWVRTNLGSADIARKEIIDRVEKNHIKLDEAWYDLQMHQTGDRAFTIVLPLHQTGFFQAKCFFIPENTSIPVWPPGRNTVLNVEPAGTCCANIIYNAFVRQFGKSKSYPLEKTGATGEASLIEELDAKGYTVIPASGKFRDLKQEVGFIFSRLGCRVLHLLPIHPTPTTYARMGRFGSPYAALNFTDVDPALAVFDPAATPLEQFMELVDAVHFHNGYLFLDIAINHTGWAASIHETNPEWLVRGEDGEIKAPGAWGIVWSDLTKLDYSNTSLWKYMADVFLLWCHRGVDGFRCDAGYMIPVQAWEYMVAKVREEYPDTLFFLEGLGGPVETTWELLSRANFNWAYSELFQHYTCEEITGYLPFAFKVSENCGHLIHFAETHDNNRLASISISHAKMRTALCALFSVCGGFGFANGLEWFASEKINVHESKSLNWGNEINQVDHIARLNMILKNHPAFFAGTKLELIHQNNTSCLVLLRRNTEYNKRLLILVNLDCDDSHEACWVPAKTGIANLFCHDLITGEQIRIKIHETGHAVLLAPGEVLALTCDPKDLELLEKPEEVPCQAPAQVLLQKRKAKILSIHTWLKGFGDLGSVDTNQQALDFGEDPVKFIRSLIKSQETPVIVFDIGKDLKRKLMIPPGFFLLVRCKTGFRAELLDESGVKKKSLGYEEAMPAQCGKIYFALFLPVKIKRQHKEYTLSLRVFEPVKARIEKAVLIYLAPFDDLVMRLSFTRKEIAKDPSLKLLCTTDRGGMMRAAACWGQLESRYDALMGANMNSMMPENRWMVLSRCRIWAIFQGYSRELTLDCLQMFWFSFDHGGKWRFHVPTSDGKYYVLELYLSMDHKENRVCLYIQREKSTGGNTRLLADNKPVNLIIRPDIEDRSFHDTVKAFKGPETSWPKAVEAFDNGFFFSLSMGKILAVTLSNGNFSSEPEWYYMVHHPLETQRGLEAESDLFSPGFFALSCLGGETACLDAYIIESHDQKSDLKFSDFSLPCVFESAIPFFQAVEKGLDAFIVNRNSEKSVIAGYPWFLDWGRDSLIFCRSLIELERTNDARAILRLFGKFENHGTLPNMICGKDAGNIETSDAPLWFFACCRDLIKMEKNQNFLDEDLDGRTIKEILLSIARSLITGTPTGVKADPDTLLLYSPAHFTWMDTNFPAGTPRQGYPVEIQALWYNALMLLASFEDKSGGAGEWQKKAKKVQKAIADLFWLDAKGYFSDCLHCDGPVAAARAVADDCLRPNQLLLFTLGVIEDRAMAVKSVETCQELLVPGGIRSLADRPLDCPLNIYHDGHRLKDPYWPYSGIYQGDEDTMRKPAYHNGTAWTWQFPIFCEAWASVFGKNSYSTSLAWLGSTIRLMRTGAVGYVPEILDGDSPHRPRGCDAQAWGTSEIARVAHKLSRSVEPV